MFLVSCLKDVTSSFIVFKHSAFPVIEVSAFEVPAILKKFVSKEATSKAAILKLSWQPGRVYVTSLRPTRNWREGEKRWQKNIHFFGVTFFKKKHFVLIWCSLPLKWKTTVSELSIPLAYYVWVIDQVWGQHGWILAKFFLCVYGPRWSWDP